MVETFVRAGVAAFDLTQTDRDGHLRSFSPGLEGETLRRRAPGLLPSAAAFQRNRIVRPKNATAALIQLDDLSTAMLERVSGVAFLTLTTSRGNHQAWGAVEDSDRDFARRLRQGSGADPSASGAARLAGSLNFKRQYAPDFPTVNLRPAAPERVVTRAEREILGLVAPPRPGWGVPVVRRGWREAKHWPS
jgi:hypothetical protein